MHCKFAISYQQWSPLVEGDEQLHRLNSQICMDMAMHVLNRLFRVS